MSGDLRLTIVRSADTPAKCSALVAEDDLPWRWKEEGGKLTSGYEMEAAKQALADCAKMNQDGVNHPDSTANNAPFKNWFNSGQALLISDRYTAWPQYFADNVAGPGFDI